jgi:hypothetical protein
MLLGAFLTFGIQGLRILRVPVQDQVHGLPEEVVPSGVSDGLKKPEQLQIYRVVGISPGLQCVVDRLFGLQVEVEAGTFRCHLDPNLDYLEPKNSLLLAVEALEWSHQTFGFFHGDFHTPLSQGHREGDALHYRPPGFAIWRNFRVPT